MKYTGAFFILLGSLWAFKPLPSGYQKLRNPDTGFIPFNASFVISKANTDQEKKARSFLEFRRLLLSEEYESAEKVLLSNIENPAVKLNLIAFYLYFDEITSSRRVFETLKASLSFQNKAKLLLLCHDKELDELIEFMHNKWNEEELLFFNAFLLSQEKFPYRSRTLLKGWKKLLTSTRKSSQLYNLAVIIFFINLEGSIDDFQVFSAYLDTSYNSLQISQYLYKSNEFENTAWPTEDMKTNFFLYRANETAVLYNRLIEEGDATLDIHSRLVRNLIKYQQWKLLIEYLEYSPPQMNKVSEVVLYKARKELQKEILGGRVKVIISKQGSRSETRP